ncbi:hypothetical protein [Streptomyces sp. YIM S03343]
MFTETITSKDGETSTGTASEAHALSLLRRAERRRHCTVEATRSGGVIVVRKVWDGSRTPKTRTIVLEPVMPVGLFTPAVRRALAAVDARSGAYLVTAAERCTRGRVGRISAGFEGVAPAAAARLVERGLVVLGEPYTAVSHETGVETRVPVRLSLAARLALLADKHRTRATAPAGYVRPADIGMTGTAGLCKPGRRSGMVYDRISRGGCSCHGWTGTYEGAEEARRAGRAHRQAVTGAFVRSLG